MQVRFEYDNNACNISVLHIERLIQLDEGKSTTYIFGPDDKLHKCTGIIWLGEDARPPVQYDSAEIPAGAKPFYMDANSETVAAAVSATTSHDVVTPPSTRRGRRRTAAAQASKYDPQSHVHESLTNNETCTSGSNTVPTPVPATASASAATTVIRIGRGRARGRGRAEDAAGRGGAPRGRGRGRIGRGRGRGRPQQQPVVDGSDDDRLEGVEVLDAGDEVDFNTDSGEEVQSDHDVEHYEWQEPAAFARDLRSNSGLARYCGVRWTGPRDRTTIPDVTNCPDQPPRFNARLEGDRPFLRLFLQALPITQFWHRVVVAESLRYAQQNTSASNSTTQRSWDPDKCTVANYLRVVASVIQRGLENCADAAEFFASQTKGRQTRQGFFETSGMSLNLYQQLVRFMHLVNSADKEDSTSDNYDKLYLVRPLIERLKRQYRIWFIPGRDNSMDEAGFPSRFTWLRNFNKTKPHRYFIEVLMACCAITRFCWSFFVNEGTTKYTVRAGRRPGQSKYVKVPHYQTEYSPADRDIQDKWGPATGHMQYFARQLRSYDPQPHLPSNRKSMTYRIHCDKRWCSIPGMVMCKEMFDIAYTSTVKKKSRYHIVHQLPVPFNTSKPRRERGKYRSATCTFRALADVEGQHDVVINCVLWSDSRLVACASADLGTAQMMEYRQQGRHRHPIPVPKMIVVRGKHFRAVDQNDQLRLGKNKFVFICKSKP